MGLPIGLPLSVAHQWVQGLSAPDLLAALEALVAVDPLGVGRVSSDILPVAKALGWSYEDGVLEVPAWPLQPPNPNVRMMWLRKLVEAVGGSRPAVRVVTSRAVAWGDSAELGMAMLAERFPDIYNSGNARKLLPPETGNNSSLIVRDPSEFVLVPPTPKVLRRSGLNGPRHWPLPPGARLAHGAKGDYYVLPPGGFAYPPEFEVFWSVYPKAVEKKEAYGVWLAIDPDPDTAQAIIEGARRYAENPYTHARGRRFVVFPSRWLQRGRWHDNDAPVPYRSEEEIGEHLERRPRGEPALNPADFDDA